MHLGETEFGYNSGEQVNHFTLGADVIDKWEKAESNISFFISLPEKTQRHLLSVMYSSNSRVLYEPYDAPGGKVEKQGNTFVIDSTILEDDMTYDETHIVGKQKIIIDLENNMIFDGSQDAIGKKWLAESNMYTTANPFVHLHDDNAPRKEMELIEDGKDGKAEQWKTGRYRRGLAGILKSKRKTTSEYIIRQKDKEEFTSNDFLLKKYIMFLGQ